MSGAAARRAALLVNVFAPRKLRNFARCRAPQAAIGELIENKWAVLLALTRLQEFGNRPLRRATSFSFGEWDPLKGPTTVQRGC